MDGCSERRQSFRVDVGGSPSKPGIIFRGLRYILTDVFVSTAYFQFWGVGHPQGFFQPAVLFKQISASNADIVLSTLPFAESAVRLPDWCKVVLSANGGSKLSPLRFLAVVSHITP